MSGDPVNRIEAVGSPPEPRTSQQIRTELPEPDQEGKIAYKVKKGDNLGKIVKAAGRKHKLKAGQNIKTIASQNGIKNPNLIRVGQTILLCVEVKKTLPLLASADPHFVPLQPRPPSLPVAPSFNSGEMLEAVRKDQTNLSKQVFNARWAGIPNRSERKIVQWLILRKKGISDFSPLKEGLFKYKPSLFWKAKIALILFQDLNDPATGFLLIKFLLQELIKKLLSNGTLDLILLEKLQRLAELIGDEEIKALVRQIKELAANPSTPKNKISRLLKLLLAKIGKLEGKLSKELIKEDKNEILATTGQLFIEGTYLIAPENDRYDPLIAGNYYFCRYLLNENVDDLEEAKKHFENITRFPEYQISIDNRLFISIGLRYQFGLLNSHPEFHPLERRVRGTWAAIHFPAHNQEEFDRLSEDEAFFFKYFPEEGPDELWGGIEDIRKSEKEFIAEYYRYQAEAHAKLAQIEMFLAAREKAPAQRLACLQAAGRHIEQGKEHAKDFQLLDLVRLAAENLLQQALIKRELKQDYALELRQARQIIAALEGWKIRYLELSAGKIALPWFNLICSAAKVCEIWIDLLEEKPLALIEEKITAASLTGQQKLDFARELAVRYFKAKNNADPLALQYFALAEKFLKSAPGPEAQAWHAKILVVAGDRKTFILAEELITQAVASGQLKEKELSEAYQTWGDLLATQEKFKEALEKYQEALENNPNNFEARASLGDTYNWLKEYAQAIIEYQVVIDRAEKDSQPYLKARLGRAESYLREENYADLDRAEEIVNIILEKEPPGSYLIPRAKQFWLEIADAYLAQSKNEFAQAYFEKILNDSGTSPTLKLQAYLRQGYIYLGKDLNKAESCFKVIVLQYYGVDVASLKKDERMLYARALFEMGEIRRWGEKREPEVALYYYHHALGVLQSIAEEKQTQEVQDLRSHSHYGIAKILQEKHDLRGAAEHAREAGDQRLLARTADPLFRASAAYAHGNDRGEAQFNQIVKALSLSNDLLTLSLRNQLDYSEGKRDSLYLGLKINPADWLTFQIEHRLGTSLLEKGVFKYFRNPDLILGLGIFTPYLDLTWQSGLNYKYKELDTHYLGAYFKGVKLLNRALEWNWLRALESLQAGVEVNHFHFAPGTFQNRFAERASLSFMGRYQFDFGYLSNRLGFDRLLLHLFGGKVLNFIPEKAERTALRRDYYWGNRFGGGLTYNPGPVTFEVNFEYQEDPYFTEYLGTFNLNLAPWILGEEEEE